MINELTFQLSSEITHKDEIFVEIKVKNHKKMITKTETRGLHSFMVF